MSWGRLKNGELLRRAEENGFEIFVRSDKNLAYQQNLANRQIAVLILETNYWPILRDQVSLVDIALKSMTPGSFRELEFPLS